MLASAALITTTLLSTLTAAFPAPAPAPLPAPVFGTPENPDGFYYPATNSLYNTTTGAITYDTPGGRIFSSHKSPHVLSTLFAFYFNKDESAGKTCKFHFKLNEDEGWSVDGGTHFDIYHSREVALEKSAGWGRGGHGNSRGRWFARMKAVEGGEAEIIDGNVEFDCPETDGSVVWGWEVVPVTTEEGTVDVKWGKSDGLWIEFF